MKKRVLAMFLAGILVLQSGIISLAEELIVESAVDKVVEAEEVMEETIAEEVEEEIALEAGADVAEEETSAFENIDELVISEVESDPMYQVIESETGVGAEENPTSYDSLGIGEITEEIIVEEMEVVETVPLNLSSDGYCGEKAKCRYTDADGGVLTIYGTGQMWDFDSKTPYYDSYKDSITSIMVEEGITYIGENAFKNFTSLQYAFLPESLQMIGYQAFINSTLSTIIMEEGLQAIGMYAFQDTNLFSVDIPESVTSIRRGAFMCCSNLQTVSLPSTLTSISGSLFNECTNLQEIVIPASVTSIGDYAFYSCQGTDIYFMGDAPAIDATAFEGASVIFYYFPDTNGWKELDTSALSGNITLREYGEGSFGAEGKNLNWTLNKNGVLKITGKGSMGDFAEASSAPWHEARNNIKEIMISDGVTSIGANAFSQCTNLLSVTIPGGGNYIGDYAFSRCEKLDGVQIPNTVTNLGDYAFSQTGLTSITLPGSLTGLTISDGLGTGGQFASCLELETVVIEEGVTVLPEQMFIDCSSLKNITLPESLKKIGLSAFSLCESLTELKIPENVTSIGDGAFNDCNNLISVKFPEGITEIAPYMFGACELFSEFIIPSGVTSIGESAFSSTAISEISIPKNVSFIGAGAFSNCRNLEDITFEGNLPEVSTTHALAGEGTYPFVAVTATIHYPLGKDGWTNTPPTDFGGTLTMKAYGADSAAFGDGLTWTYSVEGTLLLEGSGAMPDFTNYTETPWCEYKENVTKVIVDEGITSIGDHSFFEMQNLTAVSLPSTLKRIGAYAFAYNSLLPNISIPSGVTEIGKEAFVACYELENIILPKCITVLGHSVGSWTTTKAATCTAAGTRVKKCTRCKTTLNTETIKAAGHKWSSWTITSTATVFAAQKEQRKCSVCKGTENRTTGTALTPTIRLNDRNIPLQVGQSTTKIKVSGLAAGDYVKSWKSSKTSVATVNKKGKITGKKVGNATITVTLASGLSDTITVKVQKKAVKTTAIWIVGYTDFTLQKGKKFDLAASMKPYVTPITSEEKITYSSSNEKVLKVNSKGVVTAVGAGKAKIILKSGKVKDYATFTVPKVKTTAISNVPAKLTLKMLKSYTIKAKLNPKDSDEKITYKSSKKSVAIVNSKGKITALLKGTTKITVKSGSVKKVIKLTVK